MKKLNINLSPRITDHLIEGILIFASVFLAFWLNEYRVSINHESETNESIQAIISEIENNLEILERWTPYHKEIIDQLKPILEQELDTVSVFNFWKFIDGNKGIFREILTANAWNLINQSNIKVEIEKKLIISQTYEQQKYVKNAFDNLFNFLNQREILRNDFAQENYMMVYRLLLEVHAQEVAMIQNYETLLSELNK